MSCPDDKTLQLFIAGRLAQEQEERIERHLDGCEVCSKRLAELETKGKAAIFQGIRAVHADGSATATTGDNQAIPPVIPKAIGHYKVIDVLGSGGMGAVYLAENPHLDRKVAVKVVKASRSIHQSALDRFSREMKAVGKLRHPNIVQALDGGVVDGQPYLVMEHLEGSDLSKYVREHGPLPVKQACDIVRQVAAGLDYAHRLGYVHRDIKPSNLWLTPDGTVKILDFGLVGLLESEKVDNPANPSHHETVEGTILGSPDYISPEQIADSKKADNRSDIYSLGCTFYYLLTGKPPYGKATHPELADKIEAHATKPLPPLGHFRKDIPVKLELLLRSMVAKKQEDRPHTVNEVVHILDAVNNPKHSTKVIAALIIAVIFIASMIALIRSGRKQQPHPQTPLLETNEQNIHETIQPLREGSVFNQENPSSPTSSINDISSQSQKKADDIPRIWVLLRTLTSQTGGMGDALFTPTNTVIDAGENGIQLWNNRSKGDFFQTTGTITSVALSPDGRWLAFSSLPKDTPILGDETKEGVRLLASSPYRVELFDLTTGKKQVPIIPITTEMGPITTLTFSHDSKQLCLGGSCIEVWHVEHEDRSPPGKYEPYHCPGDLGIRILTSAFSLDDGWVFFGDDQKRLHCYSTWNRRPFPGWDRPVAKPIEFEDNISCIKYSPDSSLATPSLMIATGSNHINYVSVNREKANEKAMLSEMIWRMRVSKWKHPKEHAKISCMAISPDKTHVILGGAGTLDIWDMKRDLIESSHFHDAPQETVIAVDCNHDGFVFLARTLKAGKIRLWEDRPAR